MSAGEVKETLMGIGNFGGKKKKGQGQVYYVPIRDWNFHTLDGPWYERCLLRSYKGLKPKNKKVKKQKKQKFITFL